MESYEKPEASDRDHTHAYDSISKPKSSLNNIEISSLTKWKLGIVACLIILACALVGLFAHSAMTSSQISSLEMVIKEVKSQQSVTNAFLAEQQRQPQNWTCSDNGKAGENGSPGTRGPRGVRGPPGERGKSEDLGGAVYTRWGRTTCGSDSKLIYKGFAGGTNNGQIGGGANYQCMPLDPDSQTKNIGSEYVAMMAGVQYRTYEFKIFPNSAHNQNVPCARCYSNTRSALMMIPGKKDCERGWNKEYDGYLMAARHTQYRSTFECVDSNPEYINGEAANTEGGLFYFIRITCNRGGHCPPYVDGMALRCAVCTKQ